jgi:nitrous oxidase accessory protein NosD
MKRTTFKTKAELGIALLSLSAFLTASAGTINVHPGDSIQAAVDASASGDTIHIAAGVYEQQVVVSNKNLNLVGEPGALLKAPAGMTRNLAPFTTRRAVLGIVLSEANVRGLAFDGNHSGQANPRLTGVYYLASNGRLSDCSFQGFRGVVRTALLEIAYVAANLTSTGAGITHVEVLDNTFSDNEDPIVIIGDDLNATTAAALRQTFLVERNSVTGSGPAAGVFEFGIRVTVGASGVVKHNTVKDFLSVVPNPVLGPIGSAGIQVFDTAGVGNPPIRPNGPVVAQPVLVQGNRLVNNAVGVSLFKADGSVAIGNHIEGGYAGTEISNIGGIGLAGNNVAAIHNRISNSPVGINLFAHPVLGTAHDAKVIRNRICGSTTPINFQVGVTGTKLQGNKISPCNGKEEHDEEDDDNGEGDHHGNDRD